ncbi:hypothetical protein QTP88_029557 [Uroleucon formosanum]
MFKFNPTEYYVMSHSEQYFVPIHLLWTGVPLERISQRQFIRITVGEIDHFSTTLRGKNLRGGQSIERERTSEIDKEKYLKTIREKELLNKSVRSLSPASDSDSSIKRRTGLRTDKGVVHTELPITKRIRKPKYMSEKDIDKATTLIPVCTGAKNLSEFINTCDIAVKSVDKNNLPLLIKIINSKLAGNALEATKYRDTEKWEDIKSILKGAFEHRASERTLTIGLNFALMEENESVTSFASRVEELYYNLCTEGSKDMSEEESKVYKKQLKNQALIIFVNGLPKHLNLALKARDPKTIETAMQFAKDEEMEHNANNSNGSKNLRVPTQGVRLVQEIVDEESPLNNVYM